jgi:hypothetical protein
MQQACQVTPERNLQDFSGFLFEPGVAGTSAVSVV